MKKIIIVAIALLLVGHPSTAKDEDFFPAGVWYGGGKVRAPMLSRNPQAERDEWRKDLRTIKSLGFNHIKCWVDWATAEPRQGQYDFSVLEQLLSLCDDLDLRVIVQIYKDSAPEWVGEAYPEARFQTSDGRVIQPQAAPGYPTDHPGVREAVLGFIEQAARAVQGHKSFYAFDLWSEPHLANWVWFNTNVDFGFNPFTIERFREWLRNKYSDSLEKLNAAWYRTFSRWDQVEPPRFGTILSYTDLIDWKTFVATKIQEDLAMKAGAVHRVDPNITVSSHSDISVVLKNPLSGYGVADDWWMADEVNHYGISVYPKHASARTPWDAAKLMMSLDGIRSSGGAKGWWTGELQCGQGITGVKAGEWVDENDVRLWGWSVISRGSRSISYYAWYPMSSGYEANGYGMIQLDGTVTDRAKAAGEFAQTIGKNSEMLKSMRPRRSQAAVLYNPLAYLAGGNTFTPGEAVRDSMLGVYRALFEMNMQVDFVHPDQVVSGKAQDYKMIYLPYPLMISTDAASALKEYVRKGGVLISEARPGWNNELGNANERIPGAGLDEVFGCVEKEVHSVDEADILADDPLPSVLLPLSNIIIQGRYFEEHLQTVSQKADVYARFSNGDPAIVASEFGKGKAMLIGTMLGAAYEQGRVSDTALTIQRIAAWAGVEPDVRIRGEREDVEARILESDSHLLFIALNHSTERQDVYFEAPDDADIRSAVNFETGKSMKLEMEPSVQEIGYSMEPRGVLVLLMKKKNG